MSEIGIKAIGSYIPIKKVSSQDRAKNFNVDETFLKTKTGMLNLSLKEPEQGASDLAVKAVEDLLLKSDCQLTEIDCLILVTQNPDGYGLPHCSSLVHDKLKLPKSCAAFDISLGCSGYVYALSVIKNFMVGNDFKNGLLITADPYSNVVNAEDKNTSLLFGDAATATWLATSPWWRIGKFDFGTDGSGSKALHIDESRSLVMNGRAVFSFCTQNVPKSIIKTLELNRNRLSDIEQIILHQGSKYIVDTVADKLELNDKKVPFLAADYGNTVSSSIPLVLAESSIWQQAKTVLLSGFGVGLSWASTILYRA